MTSSNLPQCVGFIMDGNRRYAKVRGLSTVDGHLAGRDTFHNVVEWVQEAGIAHAVFYAFSTENWKREKEEVEGLMRLFLSVLETLKKDTNEKKVAVRIIGRRSDFSEDIQAALAELEAKGVTDQPITTIWVALSYGGRAEIVAAVNEAVAQGQTVDETTFGSLLWTSGMPDPDLIIRTGGEQRLSNFLPWQSVYSELFFTPTYWPAFTKDEFTRILNTYAERERRIGK